MFTGRDYQEDVEEGLKGKFIENSRPGGPVQIGQKLL